MPHIRLVKCAARNTSATSTAVLNPEVVAFLGIAVELLDAVVIVPCVARLITEFIGGLETVSTILGRRQGNRLCRASLGALATAEAELSHTPLVRLVILDELEIRVDFADSMTWPDAGRQ